MLDAAQRVDGHRPQFNAAAGGAELQVVEALARKSVDGQPATLLSMAVINASVS